MPILSPILLKCVILIDFAEMVLDSLDKEFRLKIRSGRDSQDTENPRTLLAIFAAKTYLLHLSRAAPQPAPAHIVAGGSSFPGAGLFMVFFNCMSWPSLSRSPEWQPFS